MAVLYTKYLVLLVILLVIYYIYNRESYDNRDRPSRRRRPGSYPGVNLLGPWRGYGSLLGYYTMKYIDYGEFEATETTSGQVLTMRPANQTDIFIEDRTGTTLKGSMRRNSQDDVYEIVGDGYTLRKEI